MSKLPKTRQSCLGEGRPGHDGDINDGDDDEDDGDGDGDDDDNDDNNDERLWYSPACFITLEIPTVTQLGPTYLPHDDGDDDEDDDGGDGGDDDDDWVLGVREGCKEEKT